MKSVRACIDDSEGHILRISFRDGEVFDLMTFAEVCEADAPAGPTWSAVVVKAVNASGEKRRFFPPGSGMDFLECDISEIRDLTLDSVVYRSP